MTHSYACQYCGDISKRMFFCKAQCKALFFNEEQEKAVFPARETPPDVPVMMMRPENGRRGGVPDKKVNK